MVAEGGRSAFHTRWSWVRSEALGEWAVAGLLVAVVLFAGLLRAATIWPQTVGLDESPYDDEGVYAAAAQLLADGRHPYRDFYYAHPPLGPLLLAPAAAYHFTNWGSPTSFMMLRYAVLLYSTLTVGLIFLIGWRLWGVIGGLVSGLLLAIDPGSVFWVGRHVLLEGPYLFLTALAVLAYVLAREVTMSPPVLLFCAGFFAAAAGGVKLQGLVVLAALVLDLLLRRRVRLLVPLLGGVVCLLLPLAAYLYWLRAADPLGQFVWMQLLRPADGVRGFASRLAQLRTADPLGTAAPLISVAPAPLYLLAGLLAILALPALAVASRAHVRRTRRGTKTALPLQRLPDDFFEGAIHPTGSRRVSNHTGPILAAVGVPSATAPATPTEGWTLLLPWTLLVAGGLFGARSYYAHYSVALALPLVLLAGVLPLAIGRAVRGGWVGRGYGVILVAASVTFCLWSVPGAWKLDRASHSDRLYTILARYAGDAVGPNGAVFALDAQIPFRAARRPARGEHDRFIVDGYGALLYQGLGIEGLSWPELFQKLRAGHAAEPYSIMWQPAVQESLRASMARSELVVIDNKSDGRLTDETRQWLAAHAKLEERQERYAIYRILR